MGMRKPSRFRQWLSQPEGTAPVEWCRSDADRPVLVVGAGPAGLAALAALRRAGVNCEGVESHRGVGGIWDISNPLSSVYEGMHTVTSRHTTHLGWPMPGEWPAFVPHAQAHHYLVRFAEVEGLLPHIRFHTRFVDAIRCDRGTWRATLASGSREELVERECRAIVVATGSHNRLHCSLPRSLWDEAAGSGIEVLHSADYKGPAPYAGKRVLIVGIGNSGTDIADKVSAVARRTLLSVRTPPWINPATILGAPCDKMAQDSTWLPHWYQMASFHVIRRVAIGPLSRLGLSTPRHRLLDCVPVTDRGIVRAVLDGRVTIRSNIESLDGGVARFADPEQEAEPVDAVIFATGFMRQYPLLPPLDADGARLDELLAFFVFHRTEPALAFMTEVVGTWSCWPVFVEQARAIAAYFSAEQRGGRHVARFNRRRSLPTPNFKGRLFAGANAYHIDYALYTRALRELADWLST